MSQRFDNFIAICVGLNIMVLCSEFYNSPQWYKDILEAANTVFVFIFMIECVIKVIGLGPKMYFAFKSNMFDFFLVGVSFLGLF